MVEMDVVEPDEEESPLRHLFELGQARAVGPTSERRDLRVQLDLDALVREPGVISARSWRSTSTAAVASETMIPSPSQVGHLRVMISRGPSVTFWRVISTRPSGEISTT